MSILVNYTYHIHFTPIFSKCSVYKNHTFSWFYQTVKCDLINSVFKTHVLKTLLLENALFKTAYPNRPLNRIQRTRVHLNKIESKELSSSVPTWMKCPPQLLPWWENQVNYTRFMTQIKSLTLKLLDRKCTF